MTVASDRLARYIAAETEILQNQEVRADLGDGRGYRVLRMADLETVRKVITDLQREVAAETANAGGGRVWAVANLSGEC
jgi:hypothetical protein